MIETNNFDNNLVAKRILDELKTDIEEFHSAEINFVRSNRDIVTITYKIDGQFNVEVYNDEIGFDDKTNSGN